MCDLIFSEKKILSLNRVLFKKSHNELLTSNNYVYGNFMPVGIKKICFTIRYYRNNG